MFHEATKITIISEQMLQDRILRILDQAGVGGYTVLPGSGKSKDHLSDGGGDRARVVRAFSIVQIETIVTDNERARDIARTVKSKYFEDYPGIVYLSPVEVLRPERF